MNKESKNFKVGFIGVDELNWIVVVLADFNFVLVKFEFVSG